MSEFRVVIVGRPNVGKSTLFNRLTGQRKAIVHDQPGVTRDRIEKKVQWWVGAKEMNLFVVDTGGLGKSEFEAEIRNQVGIALKEADFLLIVTDARAGLTHEDQDVLSSLMKSGILKKIPHLLVANKVDHESNEDLLSDFFEAPVSETLALSAEHNRGIEDLKEKVAEVYFSRKESAGSVEEEAPSEELPQIAIVGKPNVGKSTLLNAVIGAQRVVTSPVPGTTVDAVDIPARLGRKDYLLIDTAGIRRKSKTKAGVEVLSIVQTQKALDRADVALLVLDGENGISEQDEKIAGLIEEAGCGIVLVVNKWDTQKHTKFTRNMAEQNLRAQLRFLNYAPMVFISAKYHKGLNVLPRLLETILEDRKRKVSTHEFTEWVRSAATVHNPKNARFFMCHQSGRHPPTFVCHVNDPERVHFSLKRHLVNGIRSRWGFIGNPIRLHFVKKKKVEIPDLPRKNRSALTR